MSAAQTPLVLEIGGDPAVGFAGRLLTRTGSPVVKIELLPDGDGSRSTSPGFRARGHAGAGVQFHYLNQGKRSIAVDPSTMDGRRIIATLVACAGLVLIDHIAVERARLSELLAENLRGAAVRISPFGTEGPRSEEPASPATVFASAGEASMLPGGPGYRLHPDGPPLVARGHLVDFDAGVIAAMCACAALLRGAGAPVVIDVSKQEAEASLNRWLVTHFVASGWIESRPTRAYAFAGLMRCKDGFAMLQPTTDGHWDGLKAMMGNPGWADNPDYATQDQRLHCGEAIQVPIAEWVASLTTAELFAQALQHGVPAAPFRTMREVAACPQFVSRSFLSKYGPDHHLPGLPFQPHPAAEVGSEAAPDLGQHTAAVLAEYASRVTAAELDPGGP